MPGSGELYKDRDGLWVFRVRASNGQVVAVADQSYESKSEARHTLQQLMSGGLAGPVEETSSVE